MKSATDLRILPEARADIDDVYQYTMLTWDLEQADRYQGELDKALRRIKSFPEMGREIEDGLRELVLRHHIVLYRYDDDTVTVLRVINPRQLRR